MQKNTLTSFLDLLNVKYTPSFTTKHFNEHPHKYNLYGLSEMLSDYGIENVATKVEDKENSLPYIELPFIAHIGSDFVVVYQIDDKGVHFFRNGKKITVPVEPFLKTWSGVVLLANPTSNAKEPGYSENKKKESFSILQKGIVAKSYLWGLARKDENSKITFLDMF